MNQGSKGCVLIMAGGTGGHVFPALATAKQLSALGYDVEWLGTRAGIEAVQVPKAGILLHCIEVAGLRGKGRVSLLFAPVRVLKAVYQAIAVLRRVRPVAVLGMGGFASGPGGLAAWLLRRPLLIHEQNAIAGMTNRILARLAKRVMQAFPGALPKAICTGNPIRASILDLADPATRYATRQGPLRLLVVGGSLGAQAINQCLPEALALMPEAERPDVWHQTGVRNLADTQARYAERGVQGRVEAFIDDMDSAYGWADLVLCRAGALTVSEISCAGIASILVPYPYAVDDHQTANARFLADHNAAQLLPQPALTPSRLLELLQQLGDRTTLLTMAHCARQQAVLDASQRVAEQIQECALENK